MDELTCRFIDTGGRKHVIHATLTETYPNTPPVWFSESEDPKVSEAVSRLASTSGLDNHMLYQIRLLLTSLCDLFSISSKHNAWITYIWLRPSVWHKTVNSTQSLSFWLQANFKQTSGRLHVVLKEHFKRHFI